MSKKIIGVTVGTPMNPSYLKDKLNPVTSVNGVTADENGNVEITIPDSGGNVDQSGGYYQNYGKYKAVFLGDSQTDDTVGEPKKWWKWVKELLNIGECVSYGKSGSTLGDMCNRYASMAADASMVFVMGGVNNFKPSVSTPLGTINDTTPDTMYGAVRYLCQNLQKKYKKTPIIFITPTNQSNTMFVHADGLTMADFAKAMKEACKMEGVLCLDAQSSLGINPAYDDSYTSDRLHLNYSGNELLGKWVARQVNENIPILSGMESGGSGGGEVEPDNPEIPDNPDEPEITLTRISATYSGGDVSVGTDVSTLSGIVVTAYYSDNSTEIVNGYTLSGTIAEGSNTITVIYGGKTATFTVIGVVEYAPVSYTITSDLTNVITNNPVSSVAENTAYTATLSTSAGYTINTVVVTMGGEDVTATVYANGVINIASVTGDVVIVATASVEIPTEHDGMEVIKYDDLPTDMSTVAQYPGYIGHDGVLTGGKPYYHTGYIACEPGEYNIQPTVAISEAVYSADFTWKSTTQNKSPHTISLTEFSYVILNSQPNVYGYATITKVT